MRKIISRSSSWNYLLLRSLSRSFQTLAYEEIHNPSSSSSNPNPSSTALFLHGLLGSGRNWRSFSKNLTSHLPHPWRVLLPDLRNHGKSAGIEHMDPPHDMKSAARDLLKLVEGKGWAWPDVVIGHSMGGKVALEFAASCARGEYGDSAVLPKQLWILDSVPGEVNPDDSDGEVEKVLRTLQSLPSLLPSRKWVVDHMMDLGFSKSLSEWIGSNLKKEGEHVTWSFNLQGAIDMFDSYRNTSYWSFLEDPPKGLEIAIVRAQNSDRWHPPVLQKLESLTVQGKVSLHVLRNSGHWVHVDNPKGLLDIMVPNFFTRA